MAQPVNKWRLLWTWYWNVGIHNRGWCNCVTDYSNLKGSAPCSQFFSSVHRFQQTWSYHWPSVAHYYNIRFSDSTLNSLKKRGLLFANLVDNGMHNKERLLKQWSWAVTSECCSNALIRSYFILFTYGRTEIRLLLSHSLSGNYTPTVTVCTCLPDTGTFQEHRTIHLKHRGTGVSVFWPAQRYPQTLKER
jgi:hypothetical protein